MAVKVYRIQDKDGRGPWRPGFSHKWVKDREDHDNLIPWFNDFGRVDKNAVVGMAVGCGCLTKTQLRRWFTRKEYKKLLKFGFMAVYMDVSNILGSSDIQCVFERDKPLKEDCQAFKLYY